MQGFLVLYDHKVQSFKERDSVQNACEKIIAGNLDFFEVPQQLFADVLWKTCPEKFLKICRKTSITEPNFSKAAGVKPLNISYAFLKRSPKIFSEQLF